MLSIQTASESSNLEASPSPHCLGGWSQAEVAKNLPSRDLLATYAIIAVHRRSHDLASPARIQYAMTLASRTSKLPFRTVLRFFVLPLFLAALLSVIAYTYSTAGLPSRVGSLLPPLPHIDIPNPLAAKPSETPRNTHAPPKHKPTPTWLPPAATDPFPLLASSTASPPPIPKHNAPRANMHAEYGLSHMPPLFIGFTRQWPILLQAVVAYITAGWPPESIVVVENTGVQGANAAGRLSLQNPFFLNHTTLARLGVSVVRTPALLTFAQMQNFFLHTAHERSWPYYFYSHQDVLVFSFEDGADTAHRPGDRPWEFYDASDEADTMRPPAAGQPGYRTIYENCLRELNRTVASDTRWAFRWFQYDHLALGGHHQRHCEHAGGSIGALRDPAVTPKFVDPNPFEVEEKAEGKRAGPRAPTEPLQQAGTGGASINLTDRAEYFRALVKVGDAMGEHKYGNRGRNTWQASQHGGFGDPYFYYPEGFASAFDVLTEAGKEVYRRKWGHRDCDIVEGTALKLWDQWQVERDWEE
ncbi:uncharacterized protein E0L32_001622 [Thyridium curvatum]|uniref:Uncharacterized protein n=1 Tax=Thyridium curvatum TaxID=1093900 RepID=A0A507AGY5_9PEZI|nr:uncharacterized protein E0L32_001575 [Thyridium curvatum]XP_030990873.1 uncharacterized protein E0L32_001622 [Thyridium curvatum]TPX09115.1 hypothetical protein E0L32_001575 [Thyridium curvatum]TPX09162.1 hypothetical protein E0L32_001622 [Thyridium curvatum]